MKIVYGCIGIIMGMVSMAWAVPASDQGGLLDQVQALNISWGAYVLGAPLTPEQRELAKANPISIDTPGVYKFQDGNVFVVADGTSHRVIILYVQYADVDREGLKACLGDLFLSHGTPTLLAHDQLVYWAWGRGGKFSSEQFQAAREAQQPLDILSTVKFTSDVKIMEGTGDAPGNAYVIMASEPVLASYGHQ